MTNKIHNVLLDYQNPQNGKLTITYPSEGKIDFFSTEFNKNINELTEEFSVKVFFDDSLYYHNKAVKNLSIGDYYENLISVLKYLDKLDNVKLIPLYIITSTNYIDDRILKTVNECKKIRIYQYGNTDVKTDTLHICLKSYQEFNNGKEGTYTNYEPILVNNYNWFIDIKNEFELYNDKKILFIFSPIVMNNLSPKQRDFFSNDTWSAVSSRQEFDTIINWYKDEFEGETPMFDKCVYISEQSSDAFRSSLFLDILSMSEDGISSEFEILSLHYDILRTAYSYYEYREVEDKIEEEIINTRFKEGIHKKEITFRIPDIDIDTLDIKHLSEDYPQIQGQEKFNPKDYISSKIELFPTSFNLDMRNEC